MIDKTLVPLMANIQDQIGHKPSIEITTNQLAGLVGYSQRTVIRHLRALAGQGYIFTVNQGQFKPLRIGLTPLGRKVKISERAKQSISKTKRLSGNGNQP